MANHYQDYVIWNIYWKYLSFKASKYAPTSVWCLNNNSFKLRHSPQTSCTWETCIAPGWWSLATGVLESPVELKEILQSMLQSEFIYSYLVSFKSRIYFKKVSTLSFCQWWQLSKIYLSFVCLFYKSLAQIKPTDANLFTSMPCQRYCVYCDTSLKGYDFK